MGFGHLAHDRQTKPCSVGATGDEGFEEMIPDVGWWTATLVMHRQYQAVRSVMRANLDTATGRRGMDRVEDEIVQRTAHLLGIETSFFAVELALEYDMLRAGEVGMGGNAGIEKGAEGD